MTYFDVVVFHSLFERIQFSVGTDVNEWGNSNFSQSHVLYSFPAGATEEDL